jgi:Protein of unknown function (DUF3592)
MSEGATALAWSCGLFAVVAAGGILVAAGVKALEIRRARRWPSTEGRVIASRVEARRSRPGGDLSNQPFVQYEYVVGGRTYRGARVDVGERTPGSELEAVLARYPVGAAVTVFYDPADPSKALLERTLPAKAFWAVGCLCALILGAPVVAMLAYSGAVDWLSGRPDGDHAPFVAAAGGFGLAALLMAIGLPFVALRTARWPTTPGRIVSSGVERYIDTDADGRRTMYRATVVYAYEVNGLEYRGDRVTSGGVMSASFPGAARRAAAKYPVGREVMVHYNPREPGDSVLRPWSWTFVFPLLVAAAVLALAWAVATGRI